MGGWHMLSVVGRDRPGIVARLTRALYEAGANLGEATMARLGGNFAILLMVQHPGPREALEGALAPVARELGLHVHLDAIEGGLHRHVLPDVRVTVAQADRPGIVARVTEALAEAGLDIVELESDVAGTEERPLYVLPLEGRALKGMEPLERAVAALAREGLEARLDPVDTVLG